MVSIWNATMGWYGLTESYAPMFVYNWYSQLSIEESSLNISEPSSFRAYPSAIDVILTCVLSRKQPWEKHNNIQAIKEQII